MRNPPEEIYSYFIKRPQKGTAVYLYLSYIKHNPNGTKKRETKYMGKVSGEDPRVRLLEIRNKAGKNLAIFAQRDAVRLGIIKV